MQGLKPVRVRDWNCRQPVSLIHHQKRFMFKQLQQLLDFILEDSKALTDSTTPMF